VRYEVARIEHLGQAMPAADLDDALRRREEEPDASNVTGDTIGSSVSRLDRLRARGHDDVDASVRISEPDVNVFCPTT
jgi:hypothetical protein